MKRLLLASLLLSGCVTTQIKTIPNPYESFSHKQLRNMKDADICEAAFNPMFQSADNVMQEYIRRKIDCSPAALYCRNNGFKPKTENYGLCLMKYKEIEMQQQNINMQQQLANEQVKESRLKQQQMWNEMFVRKPLPPAPQAPSTHCTSSINGNQVYTNCN